MACLLYTIAFETQTSFRGFSSDVCLEAEASPRGSLEAENLLPRPRLDVLLPWLGLASPRDYCLGLASVSPMRKISNEKNLIKV